MKKSVLLLVALTVTIFVFSCRASQNAKAGKAWLTKQKSYSSNVSISGNWEHKTGYIRNGKWVSFNGFGEITLKQKGRKVTGIVNKGEYEVLGKVAGKKKIYLHFISQDWVYYVVKLKVISSRKMEGSYINYLPKSDTEFEDYGRKVFFTRK